MATKKTPTLIFALADVLKEKKLTKAEAARLCGLTYPTIHWNAKNKQRRVDMLTLEKLCKGLGVQVADLIVWK